MQQTNERILKQVRIVAVSKAPLQFVNVTVSGSWWSGKPDERGIPHTMMRDGAPNGYSIVSLDGQRVIRISQ